MIAITATLVSSISSEGAAVRTSVVHFGPEEKYTGYLACPEGLGPFPGMVVIHEWWGINDNIRNETNKLAEAGYVALAVDLFGKTTTNPDEARKNVQTLDQKAATAQMLAATDYLRSQPFVRADKIGSIGWCFGGRQSLNLATNDPKLAAAVIYYGQPITDPAELAKIHAAILGIYGEADQSIPLDQVKAFEKTLSEAGVVNEFHAYPGAGHAFANPSRGESYKPEAAKNAWEKTLIFLAKHLKG